jgi:hypothetical protein
MTTSAGKPSFNVAACGRHGARTRSDVGPLSCVASPPSRAACCRAPPLSLEIKRRDQVLMAPTDPTYVQRPLIILVDNPISDIQPNGGIESRYTFAAGLEGLQNTLTIVRVVRGDIAVTNLLRIQQTRLNSAWRSPGRSFYFCLSWCHSIWLGKPGLQQSCQGCLQC